MYTSNFEWDDQKNELNRIKHGVSFYEAQLAFLDPKRVIAEDLEHSHSERRYFCFGQVNQAIMTVRFTFRDKSIRIIGAGYRRRGKIIYAKAQN